MKNQSKNHSKINENKVENRWKINEKSIKKPIKNKMRFGIDFWSLLDGFWVRFGGQVGAKLGSKSIPRAI